MGKLLNTELKEFDATSLTGSYQNFGSTLSNPGVKVQFYNTSDVDCYISKDGSTNHFRIPANGSLTLDENTAPGGREEGEYYLASGTQLEVKQVTGAGTEGNIIGHIVTRDLA